MLAYVIHLLEEFFLGGGFPNWFTDFLNADLSDRDFLIINGCFLLLVIGLAIYTQLGGRPDLWIFALGVLFFTNGIAHLGASIWTMSYSPGLFSGMLIYWPLGILIFKKINPLLHSNQVSLGIFLGIGIQILVHLIARNM